MSVDERADGGADGGAHDGADGGADDSAHGGPDGGAHGGPDGGAHDGAHGSPDDGAHGDPAPEDGRDGTRDARRRLRDFIAANHVMTLASTGAHGPWTAPVFYAECFDDSHPPRLVFVSSPSSRHAQELLADPRAAAAVHTDTRDWHAIRGVQLAGAVRVLDGDELQAARDAYAAKFPAIAEMAQAPGPIARAFARVHWFAFVVERAFLTDNTVSFGRRDEIAFADDPADTDDR